MTSEARGRAIKAITHGLSRYGPAYDVRPLRYRKYADVPGATWYRWVAAARRRLSVKKMENIVADIEQSTLIRWIETGEHVDVLRIHPDIIRHITTQSPNRIDVSSQSVCGWNYVEDDSVDCFVIESSRSVKK